MKKLLYIFIAVIGAAFMTSCTGSATMVGGTVGYGYGFYDPLYFHGHPGMFRNNVVVLNNTTHTNTVVAPRNNRSATTVAPNSKNDRQAARRAQVQNRQNTRSNAAVAPNTRANTNVSRATAPARTQVRTAPTSRSSSAGTSARSGRGGR